MTLNIRRCSLAIALASTIIGCGGGSGGSNESSFVTVSVMANSGGSISPHTRSVARGSSTSFNITLDAGFALAEISGCEGTLNGTSFDIPSVRSNCSIEATFTNQAASPTFSAVPVKTFRFNWIDAPQATHYRLLENVDGISGFVQVGKDILPGQQVTNHVVPLFARDAAQYILQSCFLLGCLDSGNLSIDSSVLSRGIGSIRPPNSSNFPDISMPFSSCDSGSTLAIAYRYNDAFLAEWQGFEGIYHYYYYSVGSIYIFEQDQERWQLEQVIAGTDEGAYGRSISLSGDCNTLAIGIESPSRSDNGYADVGIAVFRHGNNGWGLDTELPRHGDSIYEGFADSISLDKDGSTLAVGAAMAGDTGAVYVYIRLDGDWSLPVTLQLEELPPEAAFGTDVVLSDDGSTLAVSAPGAGRVILFEQLGSQWQQSKILQVALPDSTLGGRMIDLSGDGSVLVVGNRGEDGSGTGVNPPLDNEAPGAGAIYVFEANGSWANIPSLTYIKADNSEAGDQFGSTVSISSSGNLIAVGAQNEGSSASGINGDMFNNEIAGDGAVFMFERIDNDLWRTSSYVKSAIDPRDRYFYFGRSIMLSGDGNTLAVNCGPSRDTVCLY